MFDVFYVGARVLIVFLCGVIGVIFIFLYVNKFIYFFVVFFEDVFIVYFFFIVWRVDWVRRFRFGEIFVGYLFFVEFLEVFDLV